VFETLPGQTLCEARPEFTHRRRAWPGRPAVCALLLGPRLATVASALLGCQACWLFNDQARPAPHMCSCWHKQCGWLYALGCIAHCYKPEHWVHQILAPSLCRDVSAYALILVPRSKSPWAARHSLACWNLLRPAQHACNLHMHVLKTFCEY